MDDLYEFMIAPAISQHHSSNILKTAPHAAPLPQLASDLGRVFCDNSASNGPVLNISRSLVLAAHRLGFLLPSFIVCCRFDVYRSGSVFIELFSGVQTRSGNCAGISFSGDSEGFRRDVFWMELLFFRSICLHYRETAYWRMFCGLFATNESRRIMYLGKPL